MEEVDEEGIKLSSEFFIAPVFVYTRTSNVILEQTEAEPQGTQFFFQLFSIRKIGVCIKINLMEKLKKIFKEIIGEIFPNNNDIKIRLRCLCLRELFPVPVLCDPCFEKAKDINISYTH